MEVLILYTAVKFVNHMQTGANNSPVIVRAEPAPKNFAPLTNLLNLQSKSLVSIPAEIDLHAKEIFEIIRSGAAMAS